MKKIVLLSIGVLAFALQPIVNAQTSLFTTTNDFSQWTALNGATLTLDNSFSSDSSSINGLGNTTDAGASGTSGSMLIDLSSWTGGNYNNLVNAPSEGGNAAFLSAVDPGSSGNNSVAASGNFYVDYSVPQTSSGTYFGFVALLQYDANGYYGQFGTSSTTDLGIQNNYGQEVYRATIPYTINAGQFNGFGFTLVYNSDYTGIALPFTIDNITVSAVPEPGTIAVLGLGFASLMLIRRRRQC